MISLISAVDKNFLIGNGDKLPWNLPADLSYFKKITSGKPVIMGSKTFFSLPEEFRPLPGRKNLILSRDKIEVEGAEVFSSLEKLTERIKEYPEVSVIGGATIYKLFLENNLVDRIYLTEIDGEFQGDVYFPKEFLKNFKEVSRKKYFKDKKNSHHMDFVIYDKI